MARYIDAEELIKYLYDEYHGMISDESLKIYKIIRLIDDAKTADVQEARHGKWVGGRFNDFSGSYEERCSVCDEYSVVLRQYCPNCGAKMDKE